MVVESAPVRVAPAATSVRTVGTSVSVDTVPVNSCWIVEVMAPPCSVPRKTDVNPDAAEHRNEQFHHRS